MYKELTFSYEQTKQTIYNYYRIHVNLIYKYCITTISQAPEN